MANKASEWAYRAADIIAKQSLLADEWDRKPRFRVPIGADGQFVAGEVNQFGRLSLPSSGGQQLTPAQAIEFANWILATFGDQEGA